jgi:hypothetical protein
MKKTVRVTIEKEFEIEIEDKLLNEEFVNGFEKSFWELDGNSVSEKIESLFGVAARQIAYGEDSFVEGIGACAGAFSVSYLRQAGRDISVVYDEVYDETETEIVD